MTWRQPLLPRASAAGLARTVRRHDHLWRGIP